MANVIVDLGDICLPGVAPRARDGLAPRGVELFSSKTVRRENHAATPVTDDLEDDRMAAVVCVAANVQPGLEAREAPKGPLRWNGVHR